MISDKYICTHVCMQFICAVMLCCLRRRMYIFCREELVASMLIACPAQSQQQLGLPSSVASQAM